MALRATQTAPSPTTAAASSALVEDPERADLLAGMLRAVAHPLRLRLIAALAQDDRTVTELAAELAASQPIVSQQLRILRMSGLVAVVRERGFSRYRLAEPALRGLLRCMSRCHQEER
jgi:ArsR family transcriptional regulator